MLIGRWVPKVYKTVQHLYARARDNDPVGTEIACSNLDTATVDGYCRRLLQKSRQTQVSSSDEGES